jgi:putative endonuclease
MSYSLYILQSTISGKYYIGTTGDLDDGLKRHNAGRSKATASGRPWDLVYSEAYETRSEAVQRERQLKNWKSHTNLERLVRTPQ